MTFTERVCLYGSYGDEIKDVNRLDKRRGMGEVRLSMPIASTRAWYNFLTNHMVQCPTDGQQSKNSKEAIMILSHEKRLCDVDSLRLLMAIRKVKELHLEEPVPHDYFTCIAIKNLAIADGIGGVILREKGREALLETIRRTETVMDLVADPANRITSLLEGSQISDIIADIGYLYMIKNPTKVDTECVAFVNDIVETRGYDIHHPEYVKECAEERTRWLEFLENYVAGYRRKAFNAEV